MKVAICRGAIRAYQQLLMQHLLWLFLLVLFPCAVLMNSRQPSSAKSVFNTFNNKADILKVKTGTQERN